MKRPPGLFLLVDRSTTPALRSWCSQADRLMRSKRNIRCSSRIRLRSGCGYGFCLKCRQGFGASRIQLMSASGSTSTFVWILRIRKSERLRGSVERQPLSRDSVLWCKWRTRHDSNVWPSPSEGNVPSIRLQSLDARRDVLLWLTHRQKSFSGP